MTPPRTLRKRGPRRDDVQTWNAFIDLLASEPYERLTPLQRQAHLVFRYESEVQNGGHLQYFENPAGGRAEEAVAALRALGAHGQAELLSRAIQLRAGRPRPRLQTAEEYVDEALEGAFDELDAAFYRCAPPLQAVLERVLAEHTEEFVVWVEGEPR